MGYLASDNGISRQKTLQGTVINLVSSIYFSTFQKNGLEFFKRCAAHGFGNSKALAFEAEVENVAGHPLCNQKILQEVEAGEEEIHQVDEEGVGEEIHQVVGREEEAVRKLQPILENETDQEDIPSDSDDSVASEIFELKWASPSNVGQNVATFDSSLSEEEDDDDDDNLIEISLPGSESSGLEEDPDQNVETMLPDILPESIFRQHGLKELLAEINEMNEEDNLIEIDISMGSIKCSRFEIEA
ncbi:hypothetical protein FNV43_RR03754 [Rhamnella rubrinervis]|uniref:Uncharacterized protein n=1 Tax=Rhamnella rubrinervis TaxID=2594499 RepID=A0A8K0HKH1_9ROSA|nr:hypothetical protein FNV43_RR03754 [Rhamnella rubrinervis]